MASIKVGSNSDSTTLTRQRGPHSGIIGKSLQGDGAHQLAVLGFTVLRWHSEGQDRVVGLDRTLPEGACPSMADT